MSTIAMRKTSLAVLTVTGMLLAAAPAHAQSQPVIAVQTVHDQMQTMFPPNASTPFDFLGGNVMPGTSPAISAVPGYPYAIAFQAMSGTLWFGWPDEGLDYNLGDTGLQMKAGTSPSITNVSPGFKIAFQSSAGELWVWTNFAPAVNTHLGMMAGTSPSITTLSSGDYAIAFQANTGVLWTYTPAGGGVATSATMKARTSPRIVGLSSGGFEIAYQASTGELAVKSSSGAPVNTGLAMMAGTSPGITKLSSGGFEVAFQSTAGVLWTGASTAGGGVTGTNTGLAMMPGTSPAIAALGTGFEVAFQNPNGLLSFLPPTGSAVTTTETVQTGTSPSITVY